MIEWQFIIFEGQYMRKILCNS